MKNWIITAAALVIIIVVAMSFIGKSANNQNIQSDNNSNSLTEFKWYTDLNSAIEDAKDTNKSIFALFYTSWCPACQELQSDSLSNEEVKEELAQNYVSVKIDTDSNPQLSEKYGIYVLPTILIMDSEGKETAKYSGYRSSDELLDLL